MGTFVHTYGNHGDASQKQDCVNDDKVHVSPQKIKVKVIPCEIFSRVVGYYRPIQNWNEGKVEEWKERMMLELDGEAGGGPRRP